MNKALVLLALLAVSFATSTERVEENNAADALVEEVQRMQGDIRAEQARHNELHEEQEAECLTEFAFRQQEISDATAAHEAAVAAQGRCENALSASQSDLEKTRNFISAINEILSGLAAQRLAEATSYQTLVNDELSPAIAAVEGAFPILRDFAAQEASFVQFSSHLNGMFTKMVKVGKMNHFTAIVATLLQAPEFQHGIGHEVIDQLELLFDNLLQDLQNALDSATETENAAVAKYEQTVAEYGAILANLNNTVVSLEGYIQELESCVSNESAIAASADAKRLRNEDALNFAVDACQAFETEYSNATDARNAELELLSKLVSFVRQQEEVFGNYGNDGVNAFEEYKNQAFAQRKESRANFLSLKMKQMKTFIQKTSATQRCKSCASRKSFVQKKLGF